MSQTSSNRSLSFDQRYLSELCRVDGPVGAGPTTFPVVSIRLLVNGNTAAIVGHLSVRWVSSVWCAFPQGVKLLSYLYNEAQNNCSNENYPVLLSLLKTSCEPYTRSVTAKKTFL